ncbi:MAG: hypothetical protein WBC44_12055 [Planctomycetaceae bacterium]
MRSFIRPFLLIPVVCLGDAAFGQSQTVQQPVVDTFSVGTSVSVPDRGEVFLGGGGRASERSSVRGFPDRRGAYARSASAASMSARVFIHDFEAMDAAVLNAAAGHGERPAFTKSRYDDATSYSMSRRWAALASGGRQPSESSMRIEANMPREALGGLTPPERQDVLQDVGRFLSLGAAAESRGKPDLAAIHYRYAARHGSAEAAQRLAALAKGSTDRVE